MTQNFHCYFGFFAVTHNMLPEIVLTLNSEDMKWTVEGGSEECFTKTLFLENMVKWGIRE